MHDLECVLIYPYWNVNRFPVHQSRDRPCFNLSILECKFAIYIIALPIGVVF